MCPPRIIPNDTEEFFGSVVAIGDTIEEAIDQVNEVLKSITDQNKIYRLLIPSLNFSEAQIIFKAEKRLVGKTKYSFSKMISLALSSVLNFSIKPLRWAIWLGLFAVLISLIWITYVVVAQISGWVIQGWDITNGSSLFLQQTAFTTTSATIASFGITTGTSSPMSANDVLVFTATAF